MLLALLVGSTSIAFGRIAYPFLRDGICSLWVANRGDLPIGLPNNSNLCYLNALLQAMSSSRVLVKSMRHSAAVKRSRLLCSLVAVLGSVCYFTQLLLRILGLGCSFDYLKCHDLIEAILNAHRTLIDELSLTGRWAVNDQQDVHELYAFFMDQAEESETRQTTLSGAEDLLTVSRLPPFPPMSANGVTPSAAATATTSSSITTTNTRGLQQFGLGAYLSPHPPAFSPTSFLPSSFHQFIASQIFCTKCSYRGELRLVPESCLILFPEKSRRLHTRKLSSKGKMEYRCSVETMLNDEFCAAERLTGIHCPQCHMEALRIPEAMVNDPSPLVSDRSSIRHFVESLCRNTCCARRWVALPPATTAASARSPLVIYIQRAVWLPLRRIAPDADDYVRNFTAGGMMSKFTEHVTFSDALDLAPYLAYGCTFNALARLNNVKCGGEKSKKKSLRYALRSVIVHHGNTLHAGHYVAYRCWLEASAESATSNQWILSSDQYVNPVSFSRVKDCQAYMLFYEPIEEGIPDTTHPFASTGHGINGAVVEEEDWRADGCSEEKTSLEEAASPARRIRTLMAMMCDEGELG
ncbi:Ubiquitin carboxyl-terminal hydrolase 16 [Taenia crassiceps]|uniref:ubiquitinyl hydrolase 1 n=1 Tax=Taenia crassiceps TaxID=6207 RepID=A0ABR4Q1Y1_9CEST